ncbi:MULTISPECIES: uroporphyrinogen-III synthase [unclassified Parafrankia]|uniref:uroporphyrinogen-III synthase n=1 Tax=Parafrankia TaxID=2994362 RepID=UPI000DA57DCD|nr:MULTISPECIES: uroporphyrinogen-III synthase [unclassified Parafrankia]TCJ37892.1 uroporphyrinogen-III synthase [Parafrankia sp. BMG5.11]CAI7976308.1 uroporphyrinogen III methyltransferase / synthase [Frankia sp. Hr75.2]SQD93592.1 Uroporphyrinogen III synthase HEM4 [Parafrankia sp. Ea1.12]
MATRRTKKPVSPVALVGAGPRDPGLLTVLAVETLTAADVVVADPDVPSEVVESLSAEVLRIGDLDAPKPVRDAEAATAAVVSRARAGDKVVRLYASDPWLTRIGAADAQSLAKAKIPYRVVPGVSTSAAVATYAGVAPGSPVTFASTSGVFSSSGSVASASPFGVGDPVGPLTPPPFGTSRLGGRSMPSLGGGPLGVGGGFGAPLGLGTPTGFGGLGVPTTPGDVDWGALAQAPGTLIVTAGPTEIGKVATALVEHGRAGDTPVAVTVDGTTTDQRTVTSTLDRIEADVAPMLNATANPPNEVIISVGPVVATRAKLSWWETRALFGWTVLVPRTKEQAAILSDSLRAHGASPLEVPTIAVEPPRTAAPMERAITGLVSGRYQWVAFTSVNAVKAVQEKVEERSLDARAFAGVKVAAIGEATADALRAFGIRPDLVPAGQQSSEGLLEDWPEFDESLDLLDRVLLPRADIATDTLVAGVKDRGWQVDDVTAYRTVRAAPPPAPIREALKGGRVDAVVFTSSSTVRNLVGIAGKPHETTVIAVIGPATAATAQELGLRVDVQATEASIPSLVASLAEFAAEHREELGKVGPLAARLPKPRRGSRR